jgi:hypothetical protein
MDPEIVKILVWPAVALIIAVIVIGCFRKPVTNVIMRIKNVKAKGVGIDVVSQAIKKEEISRDQLDLLVNRFASFLIPIENEIDKWIDGKTIESQDEIIRTLKSHAALWLLAYRYEVIYNVIFGTQISLLQYINSKPIGVTFIETKPYYDKSVEFGLDNFSQEQYLSYLLSNELVDLNEGKYIITIYGKGFLHFMVEANKEVDRPL